MKIRYTIVGGSWGHFKHDLECILKGQSSCEPYYTLGFRILKLVKP